tara:strand:- start:1067 stop:1315 length:249 start_codon:yes stop_codon:yes gene_type:complete
MDIKANTREGINMTNRQVIEDILTKLYDYEYIDIEKFYNADYNSQLINEFESGNDEYNEELIEIIDSFIKFETNYNNNIGDF